MMFSPKDLEVTRPTRSRSSSSSWDVAISRNHCFDLLRIERPSVTIGSPSTGGYSIDGRRGPPAVPPPGWWDCPRELLSLPHEKSGLLVRFPGSGPGRFQLDSIQQQERDFILMRDSRVIWMHCQATSWQPMSAMMFKGNFEVPRRPDFLTSRPIKINK